MLLDFNAAKYKPSNNNRSSGTVLLCTQGYTVHEQCAFGESLSQTDIYSLGVIMREASASLTVNHHRFDSIINCCTQMDPTRRNNSVKELKSALLRSQGKNFSSDNPEISAASYLAPGFRTMSPGKIIVAIPVCTIIFIVGIFFNPAS